MDRAKEMIEYWQGTTPGRIIELAIHMNDLEGVHKAVHDAEALASQEEFEGADVL